MPRRMKLHFINAMSKPIVGVKHWRILIGLKSPTDRFLGAHEPAKFFEARPRPAGALPIQSLPQYTIRGEKIVVRERRGLVHHFMRTRSPNVQVSPQGAPPGPRLSGRTTWIYVLR